MKNNNKEKSKHNISRRGFLTTTASAAVGLTIVPREVLGGPGYQSPSDMVNIAGVGIGSQGGGDIQRIATMDVPTRQAPELNPYQKNVRETYAGIPQPPRTGAPGGGGGGATQAPFKHANIYALCDVDSNYAAHMFKGYPNAKKYKDFRKMIEKEKSIDGVIIGTPDHTHAVIAAYAMAAGKGVFVEKPMTKTVYEARKLAQLAKKYNVVTQMGNQGHNSEGTYKTIEWIQSGKIGFVKELNMWTSAPSWPQGFLTRPPKQRVPRGLDYDLWLGPAPDKPYNIDLLPFNWRGLRDYGTGAMGDFGAHILDAPILALELGMPTHIQATSTPFTEDYLPRTELITYKFPKRGHLPAVTATWRDGGLKPDRPRALEANRALAAALYIGDKGMLMHGTHGAAPALIPDEPDFSVEPWLERPENVYVDFVNAIKEGRKAKNDFEISAKLTEIMLLGNIAVFAQSINDSLEYDAENMRFTNVPEANDFLHYEYRKGWEQYLEV